MKYIHAYSELSKSNLTNSKLAIKYIFIIILMFSELLVNSQLVYNNGASISIKNATSIQVKGSMENDNFGNIQNDGELTISNDITNNALLCGDGIYIISGNWINNDNFNQGLSSVFLDGADQFIMGTVSTNFNNLDLTGTGVKTLQINASLYGVLSLNDRELATNDFIMYVLTSNINAITRTTGFVSSLNNGSLSRATASNSTYEFPVGSSNGILRYRPVEIIPASANLNTFTVRMINNDATIDGYDRTLLETGICAANPDFYHRINRTAGTDVADISIFYDEIADGLWIGAAQWNIIPTTLWEDVGFVNVTSAAPLSDVAVQNWNDFTTEPYILTIDAPTIIPGSNSAICEGDDLNLTESGGSATSWSWTGPNAFSSSSQNPTIAGATTLASGIYTVIGTDAIGCTSSNTVTVTVNSAPTIIPGSNSAICEGDDLNLNESGGSATSWSWTGPNAFSSSSQNPTITGATTLASGVYTVIGTDAIGCTSSNTVTVTVNSAPIINAVDTTFVTSCIAPYDGTITIDATGVSLEYSINGGANFQTGNVFTGLDNISVYNIVVVNTITGCSTTLDSAITLSGIPGLTIDSVQTTDVTCYGDTSGQLIIYAIGATQYSINGIDYFTDSTFTGLNAGTYNVIVMDAG
ncbi:MAG: hypothetical protein ABIJ97_00795, partial [Bacteroidota bacterium]